MLTLVRITFGNAGWIRVDGLGAPGLLLYLRLQKDERGRWRTTELYVEGVGGGVVSAELLRTLPLAAIEAAALEGDDMLAARRHNPGPQLGLLASHFATGWSPTTKHWIADAYWSQVPGSGVAQPPRGAIRPIPAERPLPALARDIGAPITDAFLRQVAEVYARAAAEGRNPAPAIAEAAQVSPRTVHKWIATARRRGIMPPGQQGRVG